MAEVVSVVDQAARDKATEAAHALANHIQVTGIKLDALDTKLVTTHAETNGKIDEIKSIIKWAGGLIMMLFLSTMTWSLSQQYSANEATKKDLTAQVELLKESGRNQAAARADRQIILEKLGAPGATETPNTTVSGR